VSLQKLHLFYREKKIKKNNTTKEKEKEYSDITDVAPVGYIQNTLLAAFLKCCQKTQNLFCLSRRHWPMSSERYSFAKGIFSTFAKGFLLHKLLLKVNFSPLRVKKSRSHDMGHCTPQ
jgi:hypothetical protein